MTDERPTPALYDWAVKVWAAMQRNARMEVLEEGGDPQMVYEGHSTNLFRDLQVPNPYYTTIMRALKNQGCIAQLRRGGGSAMSKFVLIKEPSPEDFREAADRQTARKGKQAVLEQQIRDLKRMVGQAFDRIEQLEEINATREGK